ncbi:MAG: hypothetical protein LBH25_10190 [Fibromonadaceae bacterium]|nr:hypothetical protein [Fibromonadaceae bacterium]
MPKFIQRALRITSTDLPFSGTFDGGGLVVSGAYINASESFQGLFGKIGMYSKKAELRNLGVRSSYIKGGGAVGGLAGVSYGTVSGCYSTAWVAGAETLVGGLVGNLGGNATIINSYSTGIVSGDSIVGGLAGENRGSIGNSYSASKVSGKAMAGGLAGLNYGIIANSYSSGAVSGDSIAGGLAGASVGEIVNSYSIGTVAGNSEAGGLVGKNMLWKEGIVKSSYYSIETSGQSDTGKGEPKTMEELKHLPTFAGWDFDSIWQIDEKANDGYPYLRGLL